MDPATAAALATTLLQVYFNLQAAANKTQEQIDQDYQDQKALFLQNNPAALPDPE